MAGAVLGVADLPGCTRPSCSGKASVAQPGLGHVLPRDAPQGVRYLNTTAFPAPSSSSRCLSRDHLVFLASVPPGSAGAGYAQSQALGGIQPNARLCVLADPFYPQNAPHSLPPEEGVQGWHREVAGVVLQPHRGWGKAGMSVL